jgi:hypothetical protein
MDELLTAYYTADHLGSAIAVLAVASIFAVVKYGERVREGSDG